MLFTYFTYHMQYIKYLIIKGTTKGRKIVFLSEFKVTYSTTVQKSVINLSVDH